MNVIEQPPKRPAQAVLSKAIYLNTLAHSCATGLCRPLNRRICRFISAFLIDLDSRVFLSAWARGGFPPAKIWGRGFAHTVER